MTWLRQWFASSKVLLGMAILLVLFNFADAGISFWTIRILKIAYEANPFMALLLETSPYLFFGFKIIVPVAATTFLYKVRSYNLARWALICSFFLYLGLMIHFTVLLTTAINIGIL